MHPRTRELMDHLASQREILRAAFEAVPPESRDRQPAPDRWSTAGVIEHLAIVEQRVSATLAGKIAAARAEGVGDETSTDPVLPTIDLERIRSRSKRFNAPEVAHPTGLDAAAAWAALERASAMVREALQSGDGVALGSVMMAHPAFGPMSLYEWVAVLGGHEARHADQIREIASAL